MNDFKPGDRVRCLEQRTGLRKGELYTVMSAYDDGEDSFVIVTGREDAYYASRFELVEQETTLVPPNKGVTAYRVTTTKTKENAMSIEIIKTTPLAGEGKERVTVNGIHIEQLEEGQILSFIDAQEKEIAKLTAVSRVPVKMKKRASRLQKDLKTFVDLLDSLEEA